MMALPDLSLMPAEKSNALTDFSFAAAARLSPH
ncbi:MAG: hypothetical protein ACI83P_002244, partial [Janthinobacterium sp.]